MRWLTDEIKAQYLRELVDAAGNDLDHEAMIEIAKINMLDGMVTTGCCIGHCQKDGRWNAGYISIRASRAMEDEIEQFLVPNLLDQPFIDHIVKAYEQDDDREIWARFVFAFRPGCMENLVAHIVAWANGHPLYRRAIIDMDKRRYA